MSKTISGLTERYPAQLVVPVVDLLSVAAGSMLAHWLRFDHWQMNDRYLLATAVMALLVVLLNSLLGGYSRWRITSIHSLLIRLALVLLAVAILATSIIYFSHSAERYSRLWIGTSLLLSFVFAGGARALAQLGLRRARIKGWSQRSVFLVGPGRNVLKVGEGMRASPAEGYCLAGVLRFEQSLNESQLTALANRVAESGAKEVWICVPMEMGEVVRTIFYTLRNHTVELRFIPEFKDMQLLNHRISEVAGHYAIDMSVTPMSGMAPVIKRLEDLLIAGGISLLILPICLAIAIAIKLTSPGPVLFKQYRTGVNGRRVKVYKFRSMQVHEERGGKVTQATKGDARVTPLGAFLRRTSLDELPQFLNVLQGRMSIVGPRPHALAHNEYYKDIVESYMRRHKVKPGITGWAQVNGLRGETDTLDKMEKRVDHDLWYIDNWSVWLDLKIILLTVFKGFIDKNAY
ncbi:undecaprenyl-phosphate glucose phosphotransferase [Zobellella iuensis]|uniref:Undecaprenyl-phosphate glucose phosphotransferase n=1 Tax=Zobellella iuensis TaxID=2803811 RepID=A0ABS1QP56_9GAMM|nr:undecaprenyl-phosphate glucose phosphotransferase [Zobellella iuensis]MBL1376551.1 undecaprenyl-phosphate glucose phosphotransferase [Zobellella iuensis]